MSLARLSQDGLATAIERLTLPPERAGAMPPREARQLTPPVRERLVQYLRQGRFSEADLAFLEHAAVRGLAGGEQPWPTRALPGRAY